MKNDKKIVIIGGGISGVMTALSLWEKGISSTILEGEKEVLKKVLATGNGRCNFTNENMQVSCYYGEPAFIENTLNSFTVEDSLSFFDSIGVRYRSVGGYYYPYSNQASTVRNALCYMLKNSKVEVITEAKVTDILSHEGGYKVYYNGKCIEADYVVVAAGGKVGAGCGGFADKLKKLGVEVTDTSPALVGLKYKDNTLAGLNGVRARCEVKIGDKTELGEVQFGKDYISGIPIMNLSHLAKDKAYIALNFLPEYTFDEAVAEAEKRLENFDNKKFALSGLMNDKAYDLVKHVIKGEDIKAIARDFVSAAGDVRVEIDGTLGYDRAQVTAGGVSTAELKYDFCLKKYHDFYVVGEALDVDGICGGYNIHFALASGKLAADSIERKYFD